MLSIGFHQEPRSAFVRLTHHHEGIEHEAFLWGAICSSAISQGTASSVVLDSLSISRHAPSILYECLPRLARTELRKDLSYDCG